ncbi:MAG: putative amidohydrolase [Planctomycetota bacterium]|nr:putative amidohydrolase [Planctomycetota bacterium]
MSDLRMRIAGVQMDPKIGAISENLKTITSRLREAADAGARFVVFPECALSGYGFSSREEALPFTEPIPGPSLEVIASVCRELKISCVVGLLECDGERVFNACALIGPNGLVGSYRKIHLPFLGVDRFTDPGDRPFAVHETEGLRVGIHICYDGVFPEAGRTLALLGADILVLPTNWPTHSESVAEHQMPSRAVENVVYAIAVNRVGEESGFRFIGRSSIVDPSGEILASGSADREEILYAEIDLAKARQKRLVRRPGLHEINRIADRRPGFYGLLVEPNGRA